MRVLLHSEKAETALRGDKVIPGCDTLSQTSAGDDTDQWGEIPLITPSNLSIDDNVINLVQHITLDNFSGLLNMHFE